MSILFDDDLFDLEVIAGRLPKEMTIKDLCERYGVNRQTVLRKVKSGKIPAPAYADENTRWHWTAMQVAEIELKNLLRHRDLSPCGTYAAYRRHIDHKEPVDILCRLAGNRYRREDRNRKR